MSLFKNLYSADHMEFPDLYLVKQEIAAPKIEDVITTLNQKLDDFKLSDKVQAGQQVAITAGSRGIKDKPLILKELVSTSGMVETPRLLSQCPGYGESIPEASKVERAGLY